MDTIYVLGFCGVPSRTVSNPRQLSESIADCTLERANRVDFARTRLLIAQQWSGSPTANAASASSTRSSDSVQPGAAAETAKSAPIWPIVCVR